MYLVGSTCIATWIHWKIRRKWRKLEKFLHHVYLRKLLPLCVVLRVSCTSQSACTCVSWHVGARKSHYGQNQLVWPGGLSQRWSVVVIWIFPFSNLLCLGNIWVDFCMLLCLHVWFCVCPCPKEKISLSTLVNCTMMMTAKKAWKGWPQLHGHVDYLKGDHETGCWRYKNYSWPVTLEEWPNLLRIFITLCYNSTRYALHSVPFRWLISGGPQVHCIACQL